MTYEAAMIVVSRPDYFPRTIERFRAAGIVMDEPCPPHVHPDAHDANRKAASAVRKAAFKAMVDGRF